MSEQEKQVLPLEVEKKTIKPETIGIIATIVTVGVALMYCISQL